MHEWFRFLVVALFVANIITFARAIPRFARPNGLPAAMRWLSASGMVASVTAGVGLLTRPAGTRRQLAALAVLIVSAWLFRAAREVARRHRFSVAFSNDKPVRVISEGPYAWCPHPIYTAYSLTWLAAACGTRVWLAAVTGTSMIVFYVIAARSERRSFERSRVREAYEAYRRRTTLLAFLDRSTQWVRLSNRSRHTNAH